jgi:hypothetical protein
LEAIPKLAVNPLLICGPIILDAAASSAVT